MVHAKRLNGGINCLAQQVCVVAASWPQKIAFLNRVEHRCDNLFVATSTCYYPNVDKTYKSMKATYAKIDKILHTGPTPSHVTIVNAGSPNTDYYNNAATINEAFCPIMSWVEIAGDSSTPEFVNDAMVPYVNSDEICGSLGMTLISPKSAPPEHIETALKSIKFGCVAWNVNHLIGYTTSSLGGIWGAYPTEARSSVDQIGNIYNVPNVINMIPIPSRSVHWTILRDYLASSLTSSTRC